jgi:DNA-binding Xre family transcriptional regulator
MMSIVNRVPELCAKKFGGADKVNVSQIQKSTLLTYSTVRRWVKDEIDRYDAPALEAWCKYLNCQPGDILQYVPSDGEKRG